MKKKMWSLLAVFLLVCLVLPTTVAYAETPLSISVVAASAAEDGLGSPFQHHSFTADGIHWVFYQSDATDQILCSWSDDGTTWVAHEPITWCEASTASTIGGQFDTWYYVADDTVRFAVVNTSLNNSDIMYASYDVDAVAHTLTIDGDWRTAVEGVANVSYRNPTICVNNNESVFITYGYVENAVSDVYLTTTNESTDATWVPEVNFPMFNFSANASRPSMYGSVIPLYTSLTNVSIQFAGYNGSEYKIYQTNINWNGSEWVDETGISGIDSSDWYLPTHFEWNYNAISIPTFINDDDVAIQCGQTDGTVYRTFFNRRGDETNIWDAAYAKNFGEGALDEWYIGAMSLRDVVYALVYSAWDMEALSENILSNDYDSLTGNWSGIAIVDADANVPYVSTMAEYAYDPAGTEYVGFLYGTTTDDNLMYGLYGPAPTPAPSTIPASVTLMAWIVVLVLGALICIILLAYGASQAIKTGNTELAKIAGVGIITLIVAAIMVEYLL